MTTTSKTNNTQRSGTYWWNGSWVKQMTDSIHSAVLYGITRWLLVAVVGMLEAGAGPELLMSAAAAVLRSVIWYATSNASPSVKMISSDNDWNTAVFTTNYISNSNYHQRVNLRAILTVKIKA